MAASVVKMKRFVWYESLRHAERGRRYTSTFKLKKKLETPETQTSGGDRVGEPDEGCPCWVPHPRTGIYFPRGHEHVVEGIPEGAASFSQAFWLRSFDGVDRPDPDEPTHHPGSSSSK